MTNNKTYHAAVYLRLSREDGDVADGGKQVSNSIANQKELVMDYLKSHPEITAVSTYTDMYNRRLIQCPAHDGVEKCLK